MNLRAPHVLALAVASAVLLTGCGGSGDDNDSAADSKPSSSSGAATTGDVTGNGYSYDLPKGWDVPEQKIPGTEQTDSFAANLTDADGFADNVNVVRLDPAPLTDLDQLEQALVSELEGSASQDVTVRDRSTIDGQEAIHIASFREQAGSKYLAEQYNAIHDGVSYVVTFSFSDTVSQADRDDIAASVLKTWAWKA